MDCDAGRNRGRTRRFICMTTISRTIHSCAKNVATPTKRKRSPIVISESFARSNGRLTNRADGEVGGQRPDRRKFVLARRQKSEPDWHCTRDARATQSYPKMSSISTMSISSATPPALRPPNTAISPALYHKRLVSWNCPPCDRTRVGVRSGKAAGRDDQSRPFVSSIHALPLALSKTRTVTGATKPVQPKGGAGLASSHLQAGVI